MPIIKKDVLVIGAGPGGSIAAAYLQKQNYDVLVVEKQKFPRFVIGESLLPRCMEHLQELELISEIEKAGFQKKKGVVFTWKERTFEFLFAEQFTPGFTWTWQVQRAKFDKILIDTVQKRGVDVNFEHEVVAVDFSDKIKKTKVKDENGNYYTVESKFVIDASGYGRVLPKLLDLNKASSFETRTAVFSHIKNHWKKNDAFDSNKIVIDTIDDDKTWMWLIPFSDGTTSVGVVGNNDSIKKCAIDPKSNLKPYLEQVYTFKRLFSKVEFIKEPSSISGFSIGVKKMYGNGFVLCGNSTEFLDPVFSSGVTFAIESGMKAAKLVAKELQGETVDWEKDYTIYMQKGIDVFRTYVRTWYDGTLHTIFYADEVRQEVKDRISSVLAGYVWDEKNSFVKKHARTLENLAKVIQMY